MTCTVVRVPCLETISTFNIYKFQYTSTLKSFFFFFFFFFGCGDPCNVSIEFSSICSYSAQHITLYILQTASFSSLSLHLSYLVLTL